MHKPQVVGESARLVVAGALVGQSCPNGDTFSFADLWPAEGAAGTAALQWSGPWLTRTPDNAQVSQVTSRGGPVLPALVTNTPAPRTGNPGIAGDPALTVGSVALMPVVGSPLIGAVNDNVSAQVADVFPTSLNGVDRRANGDMDIGALEYFAPAPGAPAPGPVDVPVVQVPGGGGGGDLGPVADGLPGGVPLAGAPVAGMPDPSVALPSVPSTLAAGLTVVLHAPARNAVGGPMRVKVTSTRAARVVVVARRPMAASAGITRSKVLSRVVVRFTHEGTKAVDLRFRSSARRGLVTLGATARQLGFQPAMATVVSFLTGPDPVALSVPATLHVGANAVTVIARGTGRIVLVARSSSGRVLGRSVVMARRIGRMTVRITVSARIAGGTPVLVTRPAG